MKRYGGFAFDETRIPHHEDYTKGYRTRTAREKLVDRYIIKWGERDIGERLVRRRNMKAKLKPYVNLILYHFIEWCPFDTGNGRLNGIHYKFYKGELIIQVGGWFAPYIVHLDQPSNGKMNKVAFWTDNAVTNAQADLDALNSGLTIDRIDIGYGWEEFKVYDSTGGYGIRD